MYFVQINLGWCEDSIAYLAEDLLELKTILIKLFTKWSTTDEGEELIGWGSMNDEIDAADTFEEIRDMVYEFACSSGSVFRFTEVKFAQEIVLVD